MRRLGEGSFGIDVRRKSEGRKVEIVKRGREQGREGGKVIEMEAMTMQGKGGI